jgi:hypothetical protein
MILESKDPPHRLRADAFKSNNALPKRVKSGGEDYFLAFNGGKVAATT